MGKPSEDTPFHSGFITLAGRPNVGKSTLINALVGEKIAIISDKPQTTRNRITGILTTPEFQAVIIDTPGIHRHKGLLNEYMVRVAREACQEVDIVIFMADATAKPSEEDMEIAGFVSGLGTKTFLVINKADIVKKDGILPLIKAYTDNNTFDEVIPLSALKGDNLSALVESIQRHLPEGPMYYPEDELTEQPERFIAAELIREKIFRITRQEVPYATAVVVEEMKERGEGKVYIRAVVYVERDSQKSIIIGAKGATLKKIGGSARSDIERLFGVSAFLDIWVKVKKDWRTKPGALREMGYD